MAAEVAQVADLVRGRWRLAGHRTQADPTHSGRNGPGPNPLATEPHAHGWRGSTFNSVAGKLLILIEQYLSNDSEKLA